MATLYHGSDLFKALVKAFGIEHQRIRKLTLSIGVNDCTVLTTERLITSEEAERAEKVLSLDTFQQS